MTNNLHKNRSESNSIRLHLSENLKLPQSATDWLCDLFEAIQLFDDVADGDQIVRADLNRTFWSVLVGMPNNEFFIRYSQSLLPVVTTQILKWQASDSVERSGEANETSFVWRAGFYDLVLFVFFLSHGRIAAEQHAPEIMNLYGEKFADYQKEFDIHA